MKSTPIIVIALVLFVSPFALPQTSSWQGLVVDVNDGDTISVMHQGKSEEIRLYGIDCREKGQAFGGRAKHFTSRMVFGKTVEVRQVSTDTYGRTIAWVYVEGDCLNEDLLRAGLAWVNDACQSESRLADLEDEARRNKKGLWCDPRDLRSDKSTEGEAQTDKESISYHGNVMSKKFHKTSCTYYRTFDYVNCTVSFSSREEAIRAGYEPCTVCGP